VDGWSSEEPEEIVVGDRRMRVRRRIRRRGRLTVTIVLSVVVVLAAAAYGVYNYLDRPTGLAALPNPTVVAPGGFRASVGADSTITVGLEIRNVTDVSVTVIGARIVPPAGLTSQGQALVTPGERNEGFDLNGPLPTSTSVTLGTNGVDRNGILAARFTVSCDALPTAGPTGEQIDVTVRVGDEERTEALSSPVVNGTPWLTATAKRLCQAPTGTTTPGAPLPPLDPTPSA
jgi:hypothetical protein